MRRVAFIENFWDWCEAHRWIDDALMIDETYHTCRVLYIFPIQEAPLLNTSSYSFLVLIQYCIVRVSSLWELCFVAAFHRHTQIYAIENIPCSTRDGGISL